MFRERSRPPCLFLADKLFSFSFFLFACARNGRTLRNDPARCVCCQDVCVCATPPSHHRRPRCQRLSGGDGGKHTSPRFKSLVSVGENERGDAGVGEGEREKGGKNEEELQQGSHAKAAAAPPGDDEREAHFRTQSPGEAHNFFGLSKPIQQPVISMPSRQIPFSSVVAEVKF